MLIAEFERAMAEKPSLGDDTTLQKSSAPGHWPGHWPSADNPTAAYHKTTAADGPVVVNLGDTGVVPPGYRVTTGTCKIIPQPMDDQRDDVDMSADTAVTLMKEAVASSIKHNDIQHDAVGPHSLIRLSPPKDTDMQH